SGGSAWTLQGPTVGVVDATGSWLFVVNRESSNLAAISATARVARPAQNQNYGGSGASYNYSYANQGELPSVHSTTPIGPGSDGVALMGDGRTAFVYSQFDHAVYKVGLDSDHSAIVNLGKFASVGKELLSPSRALGRKLFYDANDRQLSAAEA